MYPEHYDRGWHITGTTGMLGAAAGCARLLELDVDRTAMALGIAASQPVGLREQFGTMTKPFHPGGAARAGLMAALMAQHGYTASPRALEAPRGLAQVVSDQAGVEQATDELGERFEISFNTYKPFACGIVIHPEHRRLRAAARARRAARAGRAHRAQGAFAGARADRQEGAGRRPAGQVQRLSRCAAGLIFGRAGEDEFADDIVEPRRTWWRCGARSWRRSMKTSTRQRPTSPRC